MKKRIIYFCLLLPLLFGCSQEKEVKNSEEVITRVEVCKVQLEKYTLPIRATGLLGTTTEMKLSFKTGGIVQTIHVREGSSVKKGDVLAGLDLSEVRAQVTQARIGMEKAARDLSRAENLYKDSVVTLEQFQNARSAYDLAISQKQIADFNLKYSSIKAPAKGKIQKLLVEKNELIGPGHPAILFASTENDWVVRVSLTDKDVVRLAIGDSAHILVDAFPGLPFYGEVTELGSIADPVSGTYEAEIHIRDTHAQFRTGFFSRASIFPAQSRSSVLVPIESLLDASDRLADLYVYEDGMARKVRIRTGAIVGTRVAVEEGLEAGSLVVTKGAKYLRPGMKIRVVNDADESYEEK